MCLLLARTLNIVVPQCPYSRYRGKLNIGTSKFRISTSISRLLYFNIRNLCYDIWTFSPDFKALVQISKHPDIEASRYQNIWMSMHLDIEASRYQDIWISKHLDIKAFGYWSILLKHPDIKASGYWSIRILKYAISSFKIPISRNWGTPVPYIVQN